MIYGKDFLTLFDFSTEEIEYLIDLSIRFKENKVSLSEVKNIHGKIVGLFFEKPSTRTRLSLEVACHQLGLNPIYVSATTTQLVRGEPIEDFARVVDRYVDVIVARVYSHKTLEVMAKYAKAPVINALSDLYHPLQAIADFMTIKEKFNKLENIKICFVGDTDNNVAHSLVIGAIKLGLEIRLLGPKQYWPDKVFLEKLEEVSKNTGGKIVVTDDPNAGVRDVDVVYTDVWVSMGQEREREERLKIFRRYQVTKKLTTRASPEYIYMHCLPRHRGE